MSGVCELCGTPEEEDAGRWFNIGDGQWVYFCFECMDEGVYDPDMRL